MGNNFNNSQNEINNLRNQLSNANKIINQQQLKIQELQNNLNKCNNIINNLNNNITNLQNNINKKDLELNNLRNQSLSKNNIQNNNFNIPNNSNFNINDIMCVNFISGDQKVHYAVPCFRQNTFAEVEEKLYQQYPAYRETNNNFIANGNLVLRFKTIGENKIGNGKPVTLIVPC